MAEIHYGSLGESIILVDENDATLVDENDYVLKEGGHDFVHGAIVSSSDLNDIDKGIYDSVVELNSRISTYQNLISDLNELSDDVHDGLDELTDEFQDAVTPVKERVITYGNSFSNGIDHRNSLSVDCNAFLSTGMHVVDNSVQHSPIYNVHGGIGLILVLGTTNSASQIFVEGPGNSKTILDPITDKPFVLIQNKIYTRYYNGSTWTSWKKLLYDWSESYQIMDLQDRINGLKKRIAALEAKV